MAISWNQRRIIPTGTLVGEYRVIGEPIRGGFAAVYRGVSTRDGRSAAIKVLEDLARGGRRAVERFAQEVELVQRIRHPNIVDIRDQGVLQDGRPYYVMEWLDGRSLDDELRARGPLSPTDAMPIIEQLCAALAAAHRLEVVHRDLKPANIMVQSQRGKTIIKLLDFGIAKAVGAQDTEAGLTTTGISLGTVHYMAPEQLLCRPIDASVDIYALGVLIYRMVTGSLPFDSQTRMMVQMMHLDDPPPRASTRLAHAAPWDHVIQWCMSKKPSERPASIDVLIRSLRQALATRPTEVATEAKVWLQFELEGPATSRSACNARTAAIFRGHSWMRASGWNIVAESDNALLGGRPIEPSSEQTTASLAPVYMDGAHRFVEVFGWRKIPWTASAGMYTTAPDSRIPGHTSIARAWLWSSDSAPPPDASALMLPSGVYVSRSLVGPTNNLHVQEYTTLSDFVSVQR